MKRRQCEACLGFFDSEWGKRTCSETCEIDLKNKNETTVIRIKALKEEAQQRHREKAERRKLKIAAKSLRRAEQGGGRRTRIKVLSRKVNEQTKKIRALKQGRKADGFFDSREWQDARYKVLRTYGRVCMCCGKSNGEMHVDHIKPRSKYPHLQWDFDNLQVLCRDCNMGKSNTDETDWRPKAMTHVNNTYLVSTT